MNVLQENRVGLAHQLGGAVIALHQLLARAPGRRVGESELARQRALLIEDQAILTAASEIMKAHAKSADEAFVPSHGARFGSRHQAVTCELPPRPTDAGRSSDPQYALQIA